MVTSEVPNISSVKLGMLSSGVVIGKFGDAVILFVYAEQLSDSAVDGTARFHFPAFYFLECTEILKIDLCSQ
jgi:hypothetical protein